MIIGRLSILGHLECPPCAHDNLITRNGRTYRRHYFTSISPCYICGYTYGMYHCGFLYQSRFITFVSFLVSTFFFSLQKYPDFLTCKMKFQQLVFLSAFASAAVLQPRDQNTNQSPNLGGDLKVVKIEKLQPQVTKSATAQITKFGPLTVQGVRSARSESPSLTKRT